MRAFAVLGLIALAGVPLASPAWSAPQSETIDQALCLPRSRVAGAAWLHVFVEQMKRDGFVADELARAGKNDITVAPPATAH